MQHQDKQIYEKKHFYYHLIHTRRLLQNCAGRAFTTDGVASLHGLKMKHAARFTVLYAHVRHLPLRAFKFTATCLERDIEKSNMKREK